ncbi:hypothetical protein, partial [Stenotrophomonas maltophilia]|uniref:hypothetical protein n=1 Tax=Stenotrophomonas maltophilia TaxID=40324 RepID=UPI0013DAF01E
QGIFGDVGFRGVLVNDALNGAPAGLDQVLDDIVVADNGDEIFDFVIVADDIDEGLIGFGDVHLDVRTHYDVRGKHGFIALPI